MHPVFKKIASPILITDHNYIDSQKTRGVIDIHHISSGKKEIKQTKIKKYFETEAEEETFEEKFEEKLVSKIKNTDDFWKYVEKLQWTDKSDGKINFIQKKEYLLAELGELGNFRSYLEKFVNILEEKFLSAKIPFVTRTVNPKEKREIRAFLSHIIAKGNIFYSAVYQDLIFANYLIETMDYQDVFCLFE